MVSGPASLQRISVAQLLLIELLAHCSHRRLSLSPKLSILHAAPTYQSCLVGSYNPFTMQLSTLSGQLDSMGMNCAFNLASLLAGQLYVWGPCPAMPQLLF